MKNLRAFLLPTLLGFALAFGSPARAGTVIYDSTGFVNLGADPITPPPTGKGPLADSFTTGSAANLIDVQLLLSTPAATGTISVDLVASTGSNPPSPGGEIANLATISDSSLSSTLTLVDVSGIAGVSLAAGTQYWIQLSSTDSSAYWGYGQNDGTGTGVNGEYYSNIFGVTSNNDPISPEPYQMKVTVSGSSVPEPSTLVLGMIGIGTAFGLRRRLVR